MGKRKAHGQESTDRGYGLMLRVLPIGLFLFLGMSGCKGVQPRDLAGTWVIKDASRKSLPPELQNASARIVLDANGTFVASDMPGLFYFPGRHAAQLESGSGAWKLVSHDGKQQVQLDFQVIAGWKDVLPYGTQLEVSRGSLFYFLGDADEGRRVAFDKK
jgi:hypothetical protein